MADAEVFFVQLLRALGLEASGDLLDRVRVAGDDQVDVVGHNRAGVDDVSVHCAYFGETAGEGLKAVEPDRCIFQRGFRRGAQGEIVFDAGDGAVRAHLGGGAESQQFVPAHLRRPRSARVVGKPETVAGKDKVVGENHVVDDITREQARALNGETPGLSLELAPA